MLDIYAQTFMTASRTRRCVPVSSPKRKWWHTRRMTCIDLNRL